MLPCQQLCQTTVFTQRCVDRRVTAVGTPHRSGLFCREGQQELPQSLCISMMTPVLWVEKLHFLRLATPACFGKSSSRCCSTNRRATVSLVTTTAGLEAQHVMSVCACRLRRQQLARRRSHPVQMALLQYDRTEVLCSVHVSYQQCSAWMQLIQGVHGLTMPSATVNTGLNRVIIVDTCIMQGMPCCSTT